MRTVAALGATRPMVQALRRTLPRGEATVTVCRTPAALERLLLAQFVDAVVAGAAALGGGLLVRLAGRFPALPVLAWAPLRSEDAAQLLAWRDAGLTGVLVDGVDEPACGELVARRAMSRPVRAALAHAAPALRLRDDLQLAAWELVAAAASGRPPAVAELAKALRVSREHLSRRFGAGGAPTLKAASDLARVAWASALLANPGCPVAAAARILGFASASHLAVASRRVARVAPAALAGLGPRGVVAAFVAGGWGRGLALARPRPL